MTRSRARLVASFEDGRTSAKAAATAPQRWTVARQAEDGWLEVTHQLLGDGVFGGDCHRTAIVARAGSNVLVRAVAATPLRSGAPAASVTHLRAESGASLIHLPGALVPHAGAQQANVLRIDAEAGARVLAASVVVPGRTGMGERVAFSSLRLRTVVTNGERLELAEDASILPSSFAIDGPAGFSGDGASISVVALGDWAPVQTCWWDAPGAMPGIVGGAGKLRGQGVVYRALAAHLGAAQGFLAMVELAARPNSNATVRERA